MASRDPLQKALQDGNVRAFLKAIRLGEGTSDPLGYFRIVGGQTFTSLSEHPRVKVFLPRYKVYSTAAGAYQFIFPTWAGLVKAYGFPDFSEQCQDEAAVALILEMKALEDVKAGRLEAAVAKCSKIWASLPGSTAGQRTEDFENVKQVFLDNGGILA